MKTYRLYFQQHGGAVSFGAWRDCDAQYIAESLLRRMTTNKGGELFRVDGRDMASGDYSTRRVLICAFCADGGINVRLDDGAVIHAN